VIWRAYDMARPTSPAERPLPVDTEIMANPAALRMMIEPRNSSRTASHLIKPSATAKLSQNCHKATATLRNIPVCVYRGEIRPKIGVNPPFVLHGKTGLLSVCPNRRDASERLLEMCINRTPAHTVEAFKFPRSPQIVSLDPIVDAR